MVKEDVLYFLWLMTGDIRISSAIVVQYIVVCSHLLQKQCLDGQPPVPHFQNYIYWLLNDEDMQPPLQRLADDDVS